MVFPVNFPRTHEGQVKRGGSGFTSVVVGRGLEFGRMLFQARVGDGKGLFCIGVA